MNKTLLGIDIGNTHIKLGIFSENSLLDTYTIPLDKGYSEKIKGLFEDTIFSDAVIASVVPSATEKVSKILASEGISSPLIVNHRHTAGLRLSIQNPETIGADRIANAVGGFSISQTNTIVVDSGTALTTTIVTEEGEIIGGTIMPGIRMMFHALHSYTASLPLLEPEKTDTPFGNNTKSSIISGVIYGAAGAIERIVEDTEQRIGKIKVILTGGGAEAIKGLLRIPFIHEPYLTLKGLRIIYERHRE